MTFLPSPVGILLVVLCLLPGGLCGLETGWPEAEAARLDRLFSQLDPRHEHLGPAVAAWQDGQRREACRLTLGYFRKRPSPLPGLEPTLSLRHDFLVRAERFLAGAFDPLGQLAELERRPDGGLDWRQRGPTGDKEFAWMLNRQMFLRDLLQAYEATEEPRFAEAIDEHLRDWIEQNPYPDRLTFSAPWRALEVARRLLEVWGPFFDQLRQPEVLRDETLLLLLSSVPDHADALHEHASAWGGNHLVTEKTALALAGMLWPEFRFAAQWRDEGVRAATGEILAQTYPDGAYMELSNHYQRVTLANAQHLAEILGQAGEPLPPALRERLDAMWSYFLGVAKPDGSGPLNNAGDFEPNRSFFDRLPPSSREPVLAALADETSALPDRFFPWAGHAVLRTDPSPDADWAFFDRGPHGTAHQHDDALHVSIVLGGRDFLVDAGRYTYRPGAWKDYFVGPRAHNVFTFEGFDRRARPHRTRTPATGFLWHTEAGTVVQGEQWFDSRDEGSGRSWRQERTVLHLRETGFVIVDRLTGFGPARATAHWHFAPELERDEIAARFRLAHATERHDTTWTLGSPKPVAGWHSPQYGEKAATWQRDESFLLEGPTTLVWFVGQLPEVTVEISGPKVAVREEARQWTLDLLRGTVAVQPAQADAR